jgi:transcriptional regulator with XRE-family HTH domain
MPKTVFSGAHQHLVDLLIAARRNANMTQTDLANLIGKDQKFVSLIERGQRRVDVLEFYVIAKAMGYDPLRMYGQLLKKLPGSFDI